ncbi:hypothetical protein SAMN05446927_6577 [Caballeronia arationis]|uniref:Uncharacterized protein n=1 Tax=Caballeronia arationis TaxID=1777142 RepID=A0A7Z7N6G7_9BURK|nr:hypothetical protein SAMN05446927_6577 [Caballeronia arationis]
MVGDVVYASNPPSNEAGVVLKVNGTLVFAGVGRVPGNEGSFSASQLQWSDGGVGFSGIRCQGTVSIPYGNGPYRPTGILRRGNTNTATLYIARDAVSVPAHIHSESSAAVDCTDFPPPHETAWEVESTFDLTQAYPEPLRVGW